MGVLAQLPDSIKQTDAERILIAALVVCGVGMVVVLRTVSKASTRLALLGLLFIVGVGLWWQREELEECQGQCTCRILGRDIDMPDPVNELCRN